MDLVAVMTKVDAFLIEWFDAKGRMLQRRGIKLNTALMAVALLFAGALLARSIELRGTVPPLGALLIGVWLSLATLIHWAVDDYPESARLTQTLNAHAQRARERSTHRLFWLAFALFPTGIAWTDLVLNPVTVALTYAPTIFWLGPGDFGRDKRRALDSQLAPQGAAS